MAGECVVKSEDQGSIAAAELNSHYLVESTQVIVLLCTFNGSKYLAQQLESIASQTHMNWKLYVSDDGSTDSTLDIINQFKDMWGDRVKIYNGPKKGSTKNFLHLLSSCESEFQSYYAYADQDDIWEADKLQRAVTKLLSFPAKRAKLYISRTRLVNEDNLEIGLSPLFIKKPCFKNAIVQNIGGGNTMVFNVMAKNLIVEAGSDLDVVAHDWWTYLVVSGCGGIVVYDNYPSLRYRQHGNNLIGTNQGMKAKIRRARLLFRGDFRDWNERNIRNLMVISSRLSEEGQKTLNVFLELRNSFFIKRLYLLKKSGIFRQKKIDKYILYLMVFLKKI